jgi:hypothetical protein
VALRVAALRGGSTNARWPNETTWPVAALGAKGVDFVDFTGNCPGCQVVG